MYHLIGKVLQLSCKSVEKLWTGHDLITVFLNGKCEKCKDTEQFFGVQSTNQPQ